MNFHTFKTAVAARFEQMRHHDLYVTTASKDDMWDTYLASFPEGTNPIYKERREHDCTCCKQFIRTVGNVVTIEDGQLVSIWDVVVPNEPAYQAVADALSKLVKSKPIDNIFLTTERVAGTDKNFQDTLDGVKTWEHFFINIPQTNVIRGIDIGPNLGESRAQHDVLLRSINEITDDAIDTVLELIAQNSLYRGEEHKFVVTEFKKVKAAAKNAALLDHFVWKMVKVLPASISKIRNTVIGTLLCDISEGYDLEDAVKSFEAKVAPTNYKRPTALVTKAMIDAAKKTVEELGLTSALERRYATINDITVNNILFANRDAKQKLNANVFDDLASKVSAAPKSLDKIEDVSIDKFLSDILPKADSIELMVENRHNNNLVSLIAPVDPTARGLFKWANNFSWSYNGEMADSIKERVKQAGGNVTGELCCRLAWDYADDLDFHMFEPNGNRIYFGTRRQRSFCGGMLDLDANGADGQKAHPAENIFYEKLSAMKEGIYTLKVHNYHRRSTGVGFTVEIDILGMIHTINFEKVVSKDKYVEVARLRYTKAKGIEIIESLPSTQTSREVWGTATQTFRPVNVMMMSPNYWDEQGVGNKHYFFMMEGCRNDGQARGFFNEFLKSELDVHRKVIEMVGSKMKTEASEQQLSGLGFSSTQRNNVVARIKGSFTRLINITF